MAKLLILQLDTNLPVPGRAYAGDAGLDLCARCPAALAPGGGRQVIPTGVAIALPSGYMGLIMPRSGLAAEHGITVLNAPGVVDSGYRGEVEVVLVNLDPNVEYVIRRRDRIAQLVVVAIADITAELAENLPVSRRGRRGLGHSGRT